MRGVVKRCSRGEKQIRSNKEKREHQIVHKRELNRTRKTEKGDDSMLLRLPMHLIFEILVRLPFYSILNCRCVCKTFLQILKDPCFTETHFSRASNNDSTLVIQDIEIPSYIFLAPMIDLLKPSLFYNKNYCNDRDYSAWQTLSQPVSVPQNKRHYVLTYLYGSCNGLICLNYTSVTDKKTIITVCNPILGEFIILPQSVPCYHPPTSIGFCAKTKQYKVIRFLRKYNYFEILTLGTDNWRRIDAPIPSKILCDSSFNGNFHWIAKDIGKTNSICCFNLETEQYSNLALPSHFNKGLHGRISFLYVGTLDGLFCISYIFDDVYFEACVMMDYGVKESWIKKISIKTEDASELRGAIRFLNNGVLMLNNPSSDTLACYDTRTRTTKNIMAGGNYTAMLHVPSLLSLKDIVRVENVEQVQRKMLRVFLSSLGVEFKRIGVPFTRCIAVPFTR